MKYFIQYPITFDCNLRCSYCFHRERFNTNYTPKRQFTIADYIRFRDTHLTNAEEYLVHFHGGEPFLDGNSNTIRAFMRSTKKERFDILTNGLQKRENYDKLLEFKDRIHRIGFTFHRAMIAHIPALVRLYEENVTWMHEQGFPVYVKELLFTEYREAIKEYRRYWKNKGIPVKIQDFKGGDRGKSKEEYEHYGPEDFLLIDAEYKHGGEYCSCTKNYKNVLIRGGWQDGDVLACFEDSKVVGNIQENWYNPNYMVYKDVTHGRIVVRGVPALYRGTWDRDQYVSKYSGTN